MELCAGFWKAGIEKRLDWKRTIFWNVAPFSPVNVHRRFGKTYFLHLKGRNILSKQGWNKQRAASASFFFVAFSAYLLLRLYSGTVRFSGRTAPAGHCRENLRFNSLVLTVIGQLQYLNRCTRTCNRSLLDFWIMALHKIIDIRYKMHLGFYMVLDNNTVCLQSPFGVSKNCGSQTNWASHMRFAADYSETLEVFYWPQ
jgi:hypothetical protein